MSGKKVNLSLGRKAEKFMTTQDVIDDFEDVTPNFIIQKESIIGGLFLPDINTVLLSKSEKITLRKEFAICLTQVSQYGQFQLKRESIPVDLSDIIDQEVRKRDAMPLGIQKELQKNYISYLLSKVDSNTNIERKCYLLLKEPIVNSKDIETPMEDLMEKLKSLKESLFSLIEDGYEPTVATGTEIVVLLEVSTNNYQAKTNRYTKTSPAFVLFDETEEGE